MRRAFGLTLTAASLLLAGCGSSTADDTTRDSAGAIVSGGEVGAFAIKVGDCLQGGVTGEIDSANGVPCTEPHQNEVYYSFTLPEGDGSYPGAEAISTQADQGCLDAFQTFVGLDFDSSIFDISTLTPTQASWESSSQKDREVLCLLGQAEGTLTTGSAKGTAQ